MARTHLVLTLALWPCWAQPNKTVVVLGAHAEDAARMGAAVPPSFRAQGYQAVYGVLVPAEAPDSPVEPLEAMQQQREIALAAARRDGAVSAFFPLLDPWIWQGRRRVFTGSPQWCRFSPPGTVDITTATRRPQVQSEVARFLAAHNPEITITHCIGEGNLTHHSAADLVYRAWQEARRKGARLGQLWFRAPEGASGMISEPSFRRFFESTRRGDFFVVADAGTAAPEEPRVRPAPSPVLRPRPGRQPVVMAIAAHADDVEWSFGGTFAKLISRGWKGIYVTTTNNTAGNQLDSYSPSRPGGCLNVQKVQGPFPADALETIQIRQEEARLAAAVFGAEPVFLDLHETFCWIGRRQVYMHDSLWGLYDAPGNGMITSAPAGKGLDLATGLMKKYEPDIVLAMLLGAQNPEHGQTGDLAYRAFVRAAREGARVGQLWMALAERTQYLERVRLEPNITVNVAGQLALYRSALSRHVSQNGGNPPAERDRSAEHFLIVVDLSREAR